MYNFERMTRTDRNPDLFSLPPGFRAVCTEAAPPGETDPWQAALRAAAAGVEPGCVFWNGAGGRTRAAAVFAPDRPLHGPGVLLSLGALALYDALAVFAPPNKPLHILPPDGLAVNAGRAAGLRAVLAPTPAPGEADAPPGEGVPEWAVLGLDLAVDLQAPAPGETPDETCLVEEGFDLVPAPELLAQLCRYLLFWISVWHDEGDAGLSKAVARRAAGPAGAA